MLGVVFALALVAFPAPARTVQDPAGGRDRSPRSIERLRLDCRSQLGRREVTLFGNGTVRLREGTGGEQKIWLHELDADELTGFLARLEEDRSETEHDYRSVEGAWVERCTLELDLDGREPEEFQFGRYDSVSLNLRRALSVALELDSLVDQTRPPAGAPRLPRDYEPRVGDVLRRLDGRRFRVVGFTWDGLGIELAGIEEPLTLYLPKDDLGNRFVVLERRR